MARWDRDGFQLFLHHLIAAGDCDQIDWSRYVEEGVIQLSDGTDAETTGKLQKDRSIAHQTMTRQTFAAVLHLGEYGMNRNAGDGNILLRHAPMLQIAAAFGRGREIALAGLIDPESMRLKIGGRRHMRQGQLALAPQGGNDLGGQEMCIDD